MSRLKEMYEAEIKDAMVKKFGYKNVMEIPKLDKIVVNMGVGEAKENAKILEAAVKDMEAITGQKVVTTKAKNAVANFKIREGMPIGCKVTLRGEKMYEFADRLINLALPRVRDFRGVNPNAFDGRGNYALGIKEQIIFPEIEYDKVDKVRGMDTVNRHLLGFVNLAEVLHVLGFHEFEQPKRHVLLIRVNTRHLQAFCFGFHFLQFGFRLVSPCVRLFLLCHLGFFKPLQFFFGGFALLG